MGYQFTRGTAPDRKGPEVEKTTFLELLGQRREVGLQGAIRFILPGRLG